MGTRIKIMDLELDILTEETFCEEVTDYLTNDYLNVIHLVSLDYVDAYDENELVQETLKEADLVLPGEKAILSSYHVDVLETGGMIVDYQSAGRTVKNALQGNEKCYLILRDKKEAKVIYRYIKKHCPQMEVVGLYVEDSEISEETLVNDINTKVPELIVMSMEGTNGENWIHNNKSKINAKLCVVVSSVMGIVVRENIHIPKLLSVLGLGNLYTRVATIPYSGFWRRRIFQKKMENYNNKKLLEKAEVMEELSNENEDEKE